MSRKASDFRQYCAKVHEQYIRQLVELHATWRHLGTAEDQELEIVSVKECRTKEMLQALMQGQKKMDELKKQGRGG